MPRYNLERGPLDGAKLVYEGEIDKVLIATGGGGLIRYECDYSCGDQFHLSYVDALDASKGFDAELADTIELAWRRLKDHTP